MTIGSIIYPPTQPYTFLMQRPQQLMRAFASLGISVFYFNPGPSSHKHPGQVAPNLYVFNQSIIPQSLFNSKAVLYFSYPPHVFELINYPNCLLVFDSIDAPVEVFKEWSSGYTEALTRADLVVASSARLFEEGCRYNSNVILAPNGCDYGLFSRAQGRTLEVPEELKNFDTPIIGFYGSVSHWLDTDLIYQTAENFPNCSIVIIGPGSHTLDGHRYPNIFCLGYKPYEVLPNYAQMFDVGIIPFRVSKMTEAANPVKMWEYLAAGIPVVTTALPEAKGLPEVYYSDNKDRFLNNINIAIYQDSFEKKQARISLALNNSWLVRAKAILQAFEASEERKASRSSQILPDPEMDEPYLITKSGRYASLSVKNVVIGRNNRKEWNP